MIDQLDRLLSSPGPFLLNHDRSSGEGTHWTTIFLDKNVLYSYDPLGPSVSPLPKELLEFAKEHNLQIVESPYRHQYKNSNLCGYHALLVAKLIEKLNPLTPDLFLDMLYKLHGNKPDVDDVRLLAEHV